MADNGSFCGVKRCTAECFGRTPNTEKTKVLPYMSTSIRQNVTSPVLIVEDEFIIASYLRDALHDIGFSNVDITCDSRQAVKMAAEKKPALLLMDVNLGPGRDGIEVFERIRKHGNPHAIFVTSYTDSSTYRRIKKVAPTAPILSKPVTPHLLESTIAQVFANSISESPGRSR